MQLFGSLKISFHKQIGHAAAFPLGIIADSPCVSYSPLAFLQHVPINILCIQFKVLLKNYF